MTAALGCFCCNIRSSLSLRLLLVWCPSHAIVDLRTCDYRLLMTCLLTLFCCSVNRMSGKVASFNLMALHTNTLKQEVQALACCMSRRPPPHWSSGSPFQLSCADNVLAEAHACRAAIKLAFEYYVSCLSRGIYIDSVVVQGDILPIINYLQHKGRVKKPAVVAILDQCQQLLARAPCLFRLVYLPRECNRLADYFAGQASAAAKEAAGNPLAPLHHAALRTN